MFKIPPQNLAAVRKLADELMWTIEEENIPELEQIIAAALYGDGSDIGHGHKLIGVVTRLNLSEPARPLAAFSDITNAHRVKDHLVEEAASVGEPTLYKVDLCNIDLDPALWLGSDA